MQLNWDRLVRISKALVLENDNLIGHLWPQCQVATEVLLTKLRLWHHCNIQHGIILILAKILRTKLNDAGPIVAHALFGSIVPVDIFDHL
jgi:hypothetical protein